jgi:uncharacterized protein (DUF302 family)
LAKKPLSAGVVPCKKFNVFDMAQCKAWAHRARLKQLIVTGDQSGRTRMKKNFWAAVAICAATMAQGDNTVSYTTSVSYDDVVFGLENAILDQGLVVDAVSHVGEMLERTRADVGSDKVLFSKAIVMSFCSASLSRKVMEADPMNIVFCPYNIFVAELADKPGEVHVGYRSFPKGPMQEVQSLLDGIAREAVAQ